MIRFSSLQALRSARAALSALFTIVVLGMAATATAQPAAPVATSPSGPTTQTSPVYRWNVASGGNYYFVQVGDGTSIVRQGLYSAAQVCSGSTCAFDFAYNLSAGVNYWWAVQAKSGTG